MMPEPARVATRLGAVAQPARAHTRFPKTNAVLGTGSGHKVVDLAVGLFGILQVLGAAVARHNQVVAMNGRWHHGAWKPGANKLQYTCRTFGNFSTIFFLFNKPI